MRKQCWPVTTQKVIQRLFNQALAAGAFPNDLEALGRADLVICTGGLGPTSDDLTKPAIAALFERAMRLDASIVERLRQRWRARGWRPGATGRPGG